MNIIVAYSKNLVIGRDGKIPWYVPHDMVRMGKLTRHIESNDKTKKNAIVMGRKTWESIPEHCRPLRNRINIIVSNTISNNTDDSSVFIVNTLDQAIDLISQLNVDKTFIFGGSRLYQESLSRGLVDKIYATYIYKTIEGDTYFPDINDSQYPYYTLSKCGEKTEYTGMDGESVEYDFREYVRYPTILKHQPLCLAGEYSYLDWVRQIIDNGTDRQERTGVGTKSMFGCHMQFDLEHGFPLLTTKKMFTRGIIEELLWFLRGETDANILKQKKVRIWDGNSSREYLDSIGLTHYKEGDCGPIYGFNFRHFGGEYHDATTNYSGKGFDQLQYCIDLIKSNPHSRRILINLWNPGDLDKVALPACHVLYQFFVEGDTLSCSLYQRSGDMGLGVPFNIASASFLTHIIAKLTNLKPKKLVHTIGDAHVYKNHIDALQTQLQRTPYPFPYMEIVDKQQGDINDFSVEDFVIRGYQYHPSVKMSMAV